MNALELADELDKYDWYYEERFIGEDGYTQTRQVCWTSLTEQSATMLRQQHAEIEALKEYKWKYEELCK